MPPARGRTNFDGRSYQARFDALADEGVDVHGEAALVASWSPLSVLDAGCGTGRVAIELARRGISVVGVDVDASMVAEARRRAPQLDWRQSDLATMALDRAFDIVLLAGNVPLFCPPEDRRALVASCAAALAPQGRLVAGFELNRDYPLGEYDASCAAAGLTLSERWSTWDRQLFAEPGSYAVSVHQR